jgi:hypothetical protein
MPSKYDDFWRVHRVQLAALVEGAAEGGRASLDVGQLKDLGRRSSWYGSAFVRGRDHRAEMAHMAALVKLVANTDLCARWPDVEFHFIVSQSLLLTVSKTVAALPPRRGAVPSAQPTGPTASPLLEGAPSLEARLACAEVHRLLERLPLLDTPDQVPFTNGLYIFYEAGEVSDHAPSGRIVRVGNHPRAEDRLKARLGEHYRTRQGAKNGSVFRRYLGGALMRRDDPDCTCLGPGPGAGHWEKQGGSECERCVGYEERVTAHLRRSLRFRCVRIDDMEERNRFEGLLIATLAACPTCQPSRSWLGGQAYSPVIRSSGLWNSEFVGGPQLDQRQLQRFEELVLAKGGRQLAADLAHEDLSDTLLMIPCCGWKLGRGPLDLPTRSVSDFLSPTAVETLEAGRFAAFERPGTSIDLTSEKQPALCLYTGQPYETADLRDSLVSLLKSGLHCLIVSGGYGLVRPEEPIHGYKAHLQRTAPVWRRCIPSLLADYAERQQIRRSFGAFSRQYASVVPTALTGHDWRAVPIWTRGDPGSQYHEVPQRVGSAVMRLIESGFHPERAHNSPTAWERSV